jgi:DNA invertase Pin-like site-specific DNA recombinase
MALKGNSRGQMVKAVAYIRTSSEANVGADRDSEKRQRQAIAAFARRSRHELVGEFYDAQW